MKMEIIGGNITLPFKMKDSEERFYVNPGMKLDQSQINLIDEDCLKQYQRKGLIKISYDNPRDKFRK